MNSCLLFDSDGTLVDSEIINMRAMADELAQQSISVNPDELLNTYRGWRVKMVLEDLSALHNTKLDATFEQSFRLRASRYFDRDLQPVANIRTALEQLQQARCVASNAPMETLLLVLNKTELIQFFHGNLFSAYDLSMFKPDPGLFLHAAESMEYGPENCIVIEDSLVGLQAALAAKMKCVFYNPDSHHDSHDISTVMQNSQPNIVQIDDMLKLPRAVESLGG